MKRNLIVAALCLFTSSLFSQTEIWSDTFEDTGAPSSGIRTATGGFSNGSPATDYFFRTPPGDIVLQSITYSDYEGSKIWAAENIDAVGGVNGSQNASQTITWTGIDIIGRGGLSFQGLVGANNFTGNSWEGVSFGSAQDLLKIQYRIDGGAWTNILEFYSDGIGNGSLRLDTNGDGVGDATLLSGIFQQFTASISGAGSLLDLRASFHSDGFNSEELGIDNFRLSYSYSTLPVQWESFIASNQHDNVLLQWATSSEQNSRDFTVQHSTNGINWDNIFTLPASGNSSGTMSYNYQHATAAPGLNYYRIQQTDLDGKFSYSVIRALTVKGGINIAVYPNPFASRVTIYTGQQIISGGGLIVSDFGGRVIFRQAIQGESNTVIIPIDHWAKGFYYFNIRDASGKSLYGEKILKY